MQSRWAGEILKINKYIYNDLVPCALDRCPRKYTTKLNRNR